MIHITPVSTMDDVFLFRLYASTRENEVKAWGFDQSTAEMFLQMQWNAQRQSYRMQFPDAEHSIILLDQKQVGQLMVERTGEKIRLVDIILLPEYQNQGLGAQLLRGLQHEAKQNNGTLTLSVLRSNPAKRLYERLGFIVTGSNEMYDQMIWR